jgi:hypothetical protein
VGIMSNIGMLGGIIVFINPSLIVILICENEIKNYLFVHFLV